MGESVWVCGFVFTKSVCVGAELARGLGSNRECAAVPESVQVG